MAQRKTEQAGNEQIFIPKMTFKKTTGPNSTLITIVSGKAGSPQGALQENARHLKIDTLGEKGGP